MESELAFLFLIDIYILKSGCSQYFCGGRQGWCVPGHYWCHPCFSQKCVKLLLTSKSHMACVIFRCWSSAVITDLGASVQDSGACCGRNEILCYMAKTVIATVSYHPFPVDINICAEGSKGSLNLHKGKKKLTRSLQGEKIDDIKIEAPYSQSKQVFRKVFLLLCWQPLC